ncbi:MAG: Asp-tRNA(Asn)/Glu-tRNA(Gln) amidotransferase subunit GatC [Nitrospirales bacterium]
MDISKQEVEHIAMLARLTIAEGEKELFSDQLSQILTFVDQLREADTQGVPQTSTIVTQSNALRDDAVLNSLTVDQATGNAPQSKDGFFLVPKIIADRD